MHHVDKAALAPGMCALTKTHEGPFIDFGRDFDFDHVGRIYLKESYVRELGVFCGLPSIEAHAELASRLEQAQTELDELRAQAAEQEAELVRLRDFRRQVSQVRRQQNKTAKNQSARRPAASTT